VLDKEDVAVARGWSIAGRAHGGRIPDLARDIADVGAGWGIAWLGWPAEHGEVPGEGSLIC
jgi:hypothetical protein